MRQQHTSSLWVEVYCHLSVASSQNFRINQSCDAAPAGLHCTSTGSARVAPADRGCLPSTLLPVLSCFCSPALAFSLQRQQG